MATVSQAEFARLHNVSRKTTTGWKTKGYLVFDGTKIDAEATDAVLEERGLGRFAKVKGAVTPAPKGNKKGAKGGNTKGGNKPDADDSAAPDAAKTLREMMESGEVDLDGVENAADAIVKLVLQGNFVSQSQAETVKQNALAVKHLLEVRQLSGELIALSVAAAVLFDQTRAARDAWLNWSMAIAPDLAHQFGLDIEDVGRALKDHVLKHLEEIGEPEPDFSTED